MLESLKQAGRNVGQELGRAYGSFQRIFPLPHAVNPDKAEATYRNGVLTVRLPKEGANQTRLIPVS